MKRQDIKKPQRLVHFDLLRVISMSFVVIGHVMQRYYIVGFTNTIGFAIFYSVSLALFFFTSAYFLKKAETLKDLLIYLLKLVFTYLVPAYLFTVLSIFLLPRFAEHDFGYWMNELYLRTDTFYWFFLTLFFVNAFIAISYYFTSLLIKKKSLLKDIFKAGLITLLLIAYAQVFIYMYNNPELGPATLASNLFLFYAPISLVGFLLSIFSPYHKKWKYLNAFRVGLFVVSLSCYLLALIYYSNWLEGLNGSFLEITYHMLGSLAGVLVYYLLALYLTRFKPIKSLSGLAKYSGALYLVHVFLIRLIYGYMPRPSVFDNTTMLFICLWTIVFYLGSLGFSIILVEFPVTNLLLFGNFKGFKARQTK